MAMNNKIKPFGMRDKIGYFFGDFGNDFTFMLSSMFMMKFYTDVMGISAGIVGFLMMAARFVDAITDVTMGQIVDRSKPSKHGKFKPWIRRCCGPLGISAFLIYQSGFAGMPMMFKIVWMFITYLLWGSIFYTSVNIPYGSMASAISGESADRAQLSTFRSIGSTCAQLVIGVLTPMFAYVTAENGATVLSGSRMTIIAGVFAVCGIICHMLCFNLVTERVHVPQNTNKLSIAAMFKSIFTNRALLGIIAAAIFLLLAMLGMSGMAPYIYPVYYNSSAAQSLSSLTGSIATLVLVAPVAAKLAAKFGKKELSVVCCLIAAVVWGVCFIIRPENAMVYVAVYTISTVLIGFFNFVIWAMITDVIDDSEIRNGVREDGTIYAVYSFARKLGQALSSGMIGAFMGMIGYTAAVAANPSEYPDVLSKMFDLSCLIPIIGLALVALALLFIYPLNKKKVDSNVAILREKREQEQ